MVTLGSIKASNYFDVANIDLYDVILGTPFLRAHGICLNFANNTIAFGNSLLPSLSEPEGEPNRLPRKMIEKAKTPSVTPSPDMAHAETQDESISVNEYISDIDSHHIGQAGLRLNAANGSTVRGD